MIKLHCSILLTVDTELPYDGFIDDIIPKIDDLYIPLYDWDVLPVNGMGNEYFGFAEFFVSRLEEEGIDTCQVIDKINEAYSPYCSSCVVLAMKRS